MINSQIVSKDEDIYGLFGDLINPAYPAYLNRVGLDHIAISAEGSIITDSNGSSYIDCIGGYGLFNIGHNHPTLINALKKQLDKRELFTKPLISEIQVKLAKKLNELIPEELSYSFICSGGSEAIDNAIKLARLSKRKPGIIAATNSFHGYTFGALSVSGIDSFKKQFEPLLPGIVHVPFGDADAFEKRIDSDTAAILLEIIQHEAGVVLPPENYFKKVQRICEKRKVLLIIDEIKTGFGKTGHMFALEKYNVSPDILVIGKSMGGGLYPVSAMVAKRRLWRKFGLSFSMSASSFAGNTLACCAALTTIDILQHTGLLKNCIKAGSILLKGFDNCAKKFPNIIKNVSGVGLLIGIEANQPAYVKELVLEMINMNILVAPAFGNPSVLMIEPPLGIDEQSVANVLNSFDKSCELVMESHTWS